MDLLRAGFYLVSVALIPVALIIVALTIVASGENGLSPRLKMGIGLAATLASAALFHGPAGYGERVLAGLEARIRPIVARQEVQSVSAGFPRDPMSRALVFSGRANAFQRERFVALVQEENIPGIKSIGWDPATPASREAAE